MNICMLPLYDYIMNLGYKFINCMYFMNILKLIPLGDFETGILKNSAAKLQEYIAHVNSA